MDKDMHKSTHKFEPISQLDNFVIETCSTFILHERARVYKQPDT